MRARRQRPRLPRPLLIFSLLLMTALLLGPLGAADPFFKNTQDAATQGQRDSSFPLNFRNSSSASWVDRNETESPPIRIQVPAAIAESSIPESSYQLETDLDRATASASIAYEGSDEEADQAQWQPIAGNADERIQQPISDEGDSGAPALVIPPPPVGEKEDTPVDTEPWQAVQPDPFLQQPAEDLQPLPAIQLPAQTPAPTSRPAAENDAAAAASPLAPQDTLPRLAPAQQPLVVFQQPVNEEPLDAVTEPQPAAARNPILECRSESCEETARRLKPTALSSISLDVTPSFNPNLSEPPARLQPEVREWRDLNGAILAKGQLADFRFGRVTIQDEEGMTERFPLEQLSDVDRCYVSDVWGFPLNCRLAGSDAGGQRDFTAISLSWTASALCSHPAFFEDVTLERYGYTAGPWLQPIRSGAHFFTNIAIMPYRAGIHPINECMYTLGYYRPGTPAPAIRPAFPLSVRGGLWQAGVFTGGAYLVP